MQSKKYVMINEAPPRNLQYELTNISISFDFFHFPLIGLEKTSLERSI